jgi:hypothetical protein
LAKFVRVTHVNDCKGESWGCRNCGVISDGYGLG